MNSHRVLHFLAVRTGLEPATHGVTGRYSNQLNYRTKLICTSCKMRCKINLIFNSAKLFLKILSINFLNAVSQTNLQFAIIQMLKV